MKIALGVTGGVAAYKAAEIVRNGLIGDVTRVEVGLPGGHHDFKGTEPALLARLERIDTEAELDWLDARPIRNDHGIA